MKQLKNKNQIELKKMIMLLVLLVVPLVPLLLIKSLKLQLILKVIKEMKESIIVMKRMMTKNMMWRELEELKPLNLSS